MSKTATRIQTTKRPGQHDDETAMEYLRRIVSNLNYEPESLLDDLPSIEAVVEYFGLFHTYGTDFMSGIEAAIADGADPKPLRKFVRKHGLSWDLSWIKTR